MDKVQGMAEVIIGKQRHGPIGTVKLSFDSNITKFGNLAREGFYEPH
jgi:replicative DNA helicase